MHNFNQYYQPANLLIIFFSSSIFSYYPFHQHQIWNKNLAFQYVMSKDLKAHLNVYNKVRDNWKYWVHFKTKWEYMPEMMCTKQLELEWLWLKKLKKINGKNCIFLQNWFLCLIFILIAQIYKYLLIIFF